MSCLNSELMVSLLRSNTDRNLRKKCVRTAEKEKVGRKKKKVKTGCLSGRRERFFEKGKGDAAKESERASSSYALKLDSSGSPFRCSISLPQLCYFTAANREPRCYEDVGVAEAAPILCGSRKLYPSPSPPPPLSIIPGSVVLVKIKYKSRSKKTREKAWMLAKSSPLILPIDSNKKRRRLMK